MIDKKLHILVIPSWYPEYKGHYLGSFFREQAIGIKNRGCKVGVVFPELKSLRNTKKNKIVSQIYFNDGVNTYQFKWSNWFIKLKFAQIYVFKKISYLLFKNM